MKKGKRDSEQSVTPRNGTIAAGILGNCGFVIRTATVMERTRGPCDNLHRQTVALGPLDRSFTLAILIGHGIAIGETTVPAIARLRYRRTTPRPYQRPRRQYE